MSLKPEPIHRWDGFVLLKAFLIGAVFEGLVIAPALLSPWGHAGPKSSLGMLSLVLNLPGISVYEWSLEIFKGGQVNESVYAIVSSVYLVQTLLFAYPIFVWLRWRKRKATGRLGFRA